jgi:hypothetical protein
VFHCKLSVTCANVKFPFIWNWKRLELPVRELKCSTFPRRGFVRAGLFSVVWIAPGDRHNPLNVSDISARRSKVRSLSLPLLRVSVARRLLNRYCACSEVGHQAGDYTTAYETGDSYDAQPKRSRFRTSCKICNSF